MKQIIAATALAAGLGIFGAGAAQAAIGDGIANANVGGALIAQVEDAQFFFGGQNYCWYDDGWRGPGWYWCGYARRSGCYGWGGGDGFRGWTHRGRGFNNRSFDHRTPMTGPKGPMGGPKGLNGWPQGSDGWAPRVRWAARRGGPAGGGKKWP